MKRSNVRLLPSGRWQGRYRGPDGKSHAATFATAQEAEQWVIQRKAEVGRQEWISPEKGRITVGEWLDLWMSRRLDIAASTRARDTSYIDTHIRPTFGLRPLSAVTQPHVSDWVAGLTTKLAPSSVQSVYTVFSGAMSAAVDAKLIASSPCFNVRMPVVPPGQMVILKYDEIGRLASKIDPRYRALILVGCFCGLRIGELAALSRSDIDLEERRLYVRHSAVEVRGTLVLKEPKTRRGIRSVPIAPHVAVGLSEHLGRYTERHSDAPVFPGPDGARLRPSNFRSRTWNRAVKAAELKDDPTPHDMRHTAVSHWIAAGVPILNVSRWAGHSSTAFTLDRYGHLIKEDDSAFMDAVGKRAVGGTVVPLRAVGG